MDAFGTWEIIAPVVRFSPEKMGQADFDLYVREGGDSFTVYSALGSFENSFFF